MIQIQNQIRIVTRSSLLNIFSFSFFRIPSFLFQNIVTEKQNLRSVGPVIGGFKQHWVETEPIFKSQVSGKKALFPLRSHSDSKKSNKTTDPDPTTGFNVCMRKLTALGSCSETLVFRSVRGT